MGCSASKTPVGGAGDACLDVGGRTPTPQKQESEDGLPQKVVSTPSKQMEDDLPLFKRSPHFGPAALLQSVESGAIAPLRGSYLVKLHESGGQLKRRQDLPPEAFFSFEELLRLTKALGKNYALLFVALSYRCMYTPPVRERRAEGRAEGRGVSWGR